jgi:cytochrome c
MKKTLLLIVILVFISCKKESEDNFGQPKSTEIATISGQELFENKGNCVACHQPEQKIIGPSIVEIAKIYKEKNASIVAFLKEESEPIVDPSQYEVMKTNFAITKSMSEAELQALEDYMYSFLR